ncbi:MAG: GyrI-like domain-containing protein [Methanoregulaceae archaeon]|nr:GyrI-like domain-containing protein [Methanoregulaceae archaeon]
MNVYTLPGGRMARIVHLGPYEACEPTCLKLFAWIEEWGMKITGPIREIYHNDPREVSPDEIMTEILAPVMG